MNSRASAGLEQIDRAENITARIPEGIGHGRAKIYLRRQVEHHVRVCAGDNTGEFRCLDAGTHERKTALPEMECMGGQPVPLDWVVSVS